ncbi:unnamed protein product, partial [Dibothriocephalus latus]
MALTQPIIKMLDEYELTLVLVGFMIAFLLAFGIGANDVANTFGTSVGAKVLSLRAACWLASICELTGAILLGGHVSKTIKDGIVDTSQFNNTADGPLLLMQGQVSSLAGAGIWMLIATFFHLPVSGTHSIVGATAGYGLVQFGLQGIKWMGLLKIGYVELLKKRELEGWEGTTGFNEQSRLRAFFKNAYRRFLDFLHCRICHKTETVDTESGLNGPTSAKVSIEGDMTPVRIHRNEVLSSKSDLLHQVASESTFDGRETSERTLDDVSLSMEKINRSSTKNDIMILSETDITASEDGDTISYSEPANKVDRPEEAKVFSYAQILTATFGSFVHGGNDVSNAIGPLIGLWT